MLVSGYIAQGPPSRILDRALEGDVQLIVPTRVIGELARVLRHKLGFSEERWLGVRAVLEEIAERSSAPRSVESVTGYPPDDEILASAVAANADVLVTGDRQHLLPVSEYRGVRILTPQAFLAELVTAR